MYPSKLPIKLDDCFKHDHAELFIVEGDSAALAVNNLRNKQNQAVLPMQGKPMNAIKATPKKLLSNPFFIAVFKALGLEPALVESSLDITTLRYKKIILLMDADADGIHSSALMLMFFYRYLRALLDAGVIEIVHAPVGEIRLQKHQSTIQSPHSKPEVNEQTIYCLNDPQFRRMCTQYQESQQPYQATRYRGLGHMSADVLATTCLQPATRRSAIATAALAEDAIGIFGGSV